MEIMTFPSYDHINRNWGVHLNNDGSETQSTSYSRTVDKIVKLHSSTILNSISPSSCIFGTIMISTAKKNRTIKQI
jgi:hypothetical protein